MATRAEERKVARPDSPVQSGGARVAAASAAAAGLQAPGRLTVRRTTLLPGAAVQLQAAPLASAVRVLAGEQSAGSAASASSAMSLVPGQQTPKSRVPEHRGAGIAASKPESCIPESFVSAPVYQARIRAATGDLNQIQKMKLGQAVRSWQRLSTVQVAPCREERLGVNVPGLEGHFKLIQEGFVAQGKQAPDVTCLMPRCRRLAGDLGLRLLGRQHLRRDFEQHARKKACEKRALELYPAAAWERGLQTASKPKIKDASFFIEIECPLEPVEDLHGAIKAGDFNRVEMLLDLGFDVNGCGQLDTTKPPCPSLAVALALPIKQAGPMAAVLLQAGAEGVGPLYQAVKAGHLRRVRMLVNLGLDVNALVKFDPVKPAQPVLAAALELPTQQARPMVALLLQRGANPNGWSEEHCSVLDTALDRDLDIAWQLLQAGANVEAWNASGQTPLRYVCSTGRHQADAVELLLQHKADIHAQDLYGSTALHYAAACAPIEVVQLLLEAGADCRKADKGGITPYQIVENNGHLQQIKALMDERLKSKPAAAGAGAA
jgi:ankyrin repeat protein